jgi:hypothetical protein
MCLYAIISKIQEKLDKVDTDELANIIGRDIYKVRDENERMLQEVRSSHEEYVITNANSINTNNIAPNPRYMSLILF